MIASNGPKGLPFHLRANVLFLANFDNPANRDAIDWMLSEIWPQFESLCQRCNSLLSVTAFPRNLD
jgi:hypothetical protein